MSEEEIRLDQTKKVFDTIGTLIEKNKTCSYRYLIYDLLGFKEKDYATLLSGMSLTNRLVEFEIRGEIINKIKEYCKENSERDYGEYDRYGDVLDFINELLEEIE